jgi:hypothetical protein
MGKVSDYCPAHDYGDPGFPPDECPACKALNAPDMSRDDYYQPIKLEMSAYKEPPKEKICEHCGASYSTGNIGKIGTTHAALAGGDASNVTDIGSTPTVDRLTRQRDAALTLAERYREALVKAEAFLDENYYRLPMSGREAAALATIRIALQQGKGEGE